MGFFDKLTNTIPKEDDTADKYYEEAKKDSKDDEGLEDEKNIKLEPDDENDIKDDDPYADITETSTKKRKIAKSEEDDGFRIFSLKWWEFIVVMIEIFLFVYTMLVLFSVVPIF